MKKSSMKIALCGMIGALCVTVMLMGYIFPFATYASPAVASWLLLPIVYEYRQKTAFTLYTAVSFLTLMLVPEREQALMFVVVFGLYMVLKFSIDKIKNKALRLIVKLTYANISFAVVYGLLILVFPVTALINEFKEYTVGFMVLLVLMLNLVFIMCDKARERVLIIYVYKLRPKIFRR